MFPPFILAKLYVKGSLKNNPDGFEFSLKNIIDSTLLMGIGPIVAGGQSYTGAAITMKAGDTVYQGDKLSRDNAVPVKMGVPILVQVKGQPLSSGPQVVSVSATTTDIGMIKFEIKDNIA
jgi:hypothetical protein